jgi:hypothetical protein
VLNRPRKQHDDVFLGKLTFKNDHPLCLYELVILAATVHKSEPCWELVSHNCHWFVRLAIQVLETCFQIKFESPKLPQSNPSKLCEFPIYKPEPWEHVGTVVHTFKESVRNFEEEVSSGIGILA